MTPIVLFDGDCHFCDWSVQFIIKHDHKGIYYFAPLQSKRAQVLLEKHQISFDVNSIVLIENENAFIKSCAVLRICRNLNGIWRLLYLFNVLPKRLLNSFYDVIAKNRYKWFGKKTHCQIYPEDIRKRFLVD
jgi:predicted DCC family thiol-disulfide oxidoreductase YuxK